MFLTTVQDTITAVNQRVPGYELTAIGPDAIVTGAYANCFGRAALTAAALHAEGIEEEAMHMLVSLNHGLPYTKVDQQEQRHWYGHAQLIVQLGEVATTVDSHIDVFMRPVSPSWPDINARPSIIYEDPSDFFISPRVPRYIGDRAHMFSVHTLAEGIAYYQAEHPSHNSCNFTLADYGDACRQLEIIPDSTQPAL